MTQKAITHERLEVAMAADENYAMPLAATMASILSSLAPTAALRLHIVDGGIQPQTRERLLRSWNDPRLEIVWLEPDLSRTAGCPVSGHVNRTAYARLLLPSILPPDIEKVIYLDSDLLVLKDLSQMWAEPFQGAPLLAIGDVAAPRIDAEISLPNYKKIRRLLASPRPVVNYRELGMDPTALYFNSGVLVMDLKAWRREGLAEQAFECLDVHRKHVLYWDQYAFNVVLYGRWRALDPRWNQGEHLYQYPTAKRSPLEPELYRTLHRDPWIVHFTSQRKPWCFGSKHPYRKRFFKVLDQTDWRGWRPEKPYQGLLGWVNYRIEQYRQAQLQQKPKRKGRKVRKAA